MDMPHELSRFRPRVRCWLSKRAATERGFSLVELLVATFVLTVGLVSLAQLVATTAVLHAEARLYSLAAREADLKIDELMKLNLATAPAVQITPANPDSLDQNVANYFDTPAPGITRRWRVQAGPVADTRVVTVRVINAGLARNQQVDITTIIRQW